MSLGRVVVGGVGGHGFHRFVEAEALLGWMWSEQTSPLLVYHQAVLNFGFHTIKRKVGAG